MKGIGSNTMKKKTLGFLAAVLSMCMLAGCGAKDTGDGTGCSDRRRSRKYCIEGYGCGQVCDTWASTRGWKYP